MKEEDEDVRTLSEKVSEVKVITSDWVRIDKVRRIRQVIVGIIAVRLRLRLRLRVLMAEEDLCYSSCLLSATVGTQKFSLQILLARGLRVIDIPCLLYKSTPYRLKFGKNIYNIFNFFFFDIKYIQRK